MNKSIKIIFLTILILLVSIIISNKTFVNYECQELNNRAFYIKNVATGNYLSLEENTPYAGLNVCQRIYRK